MAQQYHHVVRYMTKTVRVLISVLSSAVESKMFSLRFLYSYFPSYLDHHKSIRSTTHFPYYYRLLTNVMQIREVWSLTMQYTSTDHPNPNKFKWYFLHLGWKSLISTVHRWRCKERPLLSVSFLKLYYYWTKFWCMPLYSTFQIFIQIIFFWVFNGSMIF